MWKRYGVVVTFIAVLLLVPTLASAQAIRGTARDTTGGVLPGVTVEARSPALIEQVRTAFTDGAGQYQIVELRPGTYSVTFTLPGFNTVVREGIELTTGFTANVDVELRVGAVEETITVTGASPIVDVQNVTQRQVSTREVIDTVPVARSFQSLGVLIPGITTSGTTGIMVQDVGGQSGQNHMTMAIHGGRTGDQHVQVDGMGVESMNREDSAGQYLPDMTFQEYVFDYSANTADTETGGVRINQIPAEGGNIFSGGLFYNVLPPAWQSGNVDDRLRGLGFFHGNRVKENWAVEAKLGGPIVRDRAWFFLAYSRFRVDNWVGGTYYAQDARARVYVPDLSKQAVAEQKAYTSTGRLTIQATPRNKVTAYMTHGPQNYPHWLVGLIGTVIRVPEASIRTKAGNHLYQATWAAPVTSRLLFEAGASHGPQPVWWPGQEYAQNDIPGILDVSAGRYERNAGAGWQATKRRTPYTTNTSRGSMSYVTGSHAFKAGFSYTWSKHHDKHYFHDELGALPMSYQTFAGRPLQVTYYDAPAARYYNMDNLGIYAQDQWRVERLTVNAGVRFGYFVNSYPDHTAPPSIFVPVTRFYPAQDAVSWKDLSPRLGAAYDLFGDGKTALKATVSHYVLREGNGYAVRINPINSNRSNSRSWTDLDNDFFPDGDPLNPDRNGELGPSSNRDFTNPHINTFYDPDWAFGFGQRPANWEFAGSIQRELAPGLSVDAGYFRRVFTNFEVRDNRAVGPNDVDYFCVTAPVDPRLPNGGGQEICGVPDLKPSAVGLIDHITTGSDNFGTRRQHWNGVDVTVDARLQGVLLQGGISTGKISVDECDLVRALPEVLFQSTRIPTTYCDNITVSSLTEASTLGGSSEPFLTQVKFLGSYTLPYEVQVAATYQTFPGRERVANVTFLNAAVQPSLGRPLSQTTSVQVNVIEPGTVYAPRLHQLDLRFTKLLNLGGARLRGMLDLYNIFNDNTPLTLPAAFNPLNPVAWERPGTILPSRVFKLNVQLDF